MEGSFIDWQVPVRTADGTIVSAYWREYANGWSYLYADGERGPEDNVLASVYRAPDGRVSLAAREKGTEARLVGLAPVEAMALIAMLRTAVYPDRDNEGS